MIHIPNPITILTDTSEQLPLPLQDIKSILWCPALGDDPVRLRLRHKSVRLKFGDYALQDYEHVCCIETKRSGLELYGNLLTRDRTRSDRALRRLALGCTNPYLLVEGSIPDTQRRLIGWTFGRKTVTTAAPMWDALCEKLVAYGIGLLFTGPLSAPASRRIVAEFVLRLALSHAERHERNKVSEAP